MGESLLRFQYYHCIGEGVKQLKLRKIMERAGIGIDEELSEDYKKSDELTNEPERLRVSVDGVSILCDVEKGENGELYFNIMGYYSEKDVVTSGKMTAVEKFLEDVEKIRNLFPPSRELLIGSFDAGGSGDIEDADSGEFGFNYHLFRGTKKAKK